MKKLLIQLLILPFAIVSANLAAGEPADRPAAENNDPASFLEIYSEFNGRCQGLRRGDIRMLRNTHPSKTIQYRMVRLLGGHRQASLIQDTITPSDEGQKLGCEVLDDREQTWKVVRASFVD